jgi:hypothetical protein
MAAPLTRSDTADLNALSHIAKAFQYRNVSAETP